MPFSLEQLHAKYHKVLLNSLGAEIKDLTKSDVRTLVGATQGGANQKIHLTMQQTRPSHADFLRALGILENPADAKMGGTSARRRVLTPEPEQGLVSIMGPDGEFYDNAVRTFGVVSSGQNWGPSRKRGSKMGFKLAERKKVYVLFPGGAIFITRKRDPRWSFSNNIFF